MRPAICLAVMPAWLGVPERVFFFFLKKDAKLLRELPAPLLSFLSLLVLETLVSFLKEIGRLWGRDGAAFEPLSRCYPLA